MIDIHSHILPNVDDGSKSLENSLRILKHEVNNGVKKIVLTPHYKIDNYTPTVSEIKSSFNELINAVKTQKIDVELFLGQEIYCDENIYKRLENKEVLTMNNSNCILVEFSYDEFQDISDYVYNFTKLGYTPIIAHFERYAYLDWNILIELKQMGALIQTNASAVIGEDGKKVQRAIITAIKQGIVDFVAGDCHAHNPSIIGKAYKKVLKYCGQKIADQLFENNAKKYLLV